METFVGALDLTGFRDVAGRTAIGYAIRKSARLAGLVIVDVSPAARRLGPDAPRHGAARQLDSVEEFVARVTVFNPGCDRALLRRSLLHNLHRLRNGK